MDIVTNPTRFVSVEPGDEVLLTHDIGTFCLMGDPGQQPGGHSIEPGTRHPGPREGLLLRYDGAGTYRLQL
jgi:hypothetical protein